MATQPAHPEPRLPLSREKVLDAAIALADRDGIESLSMRRLGQELGVEAMSLYNHVANKDDIFDGIVEIVLREIEIPQTGWTGRRRSAGPAISSHETFVRHRWACGLLMRGPGQVPCAWSGWRPSSERCAGPASRPT